MINEINLNEFIHRALKHLSIRNEFYGKYMSNFTYELSENVSKCVDYYITTTGEVQCLVNPKAELEAVIKELEHVALHLIKDPVPNVNPGSKFDVLCANMAFDAVTQSENWHGLPYNKTTDYYYRRLTNPDFSENGEKTLRQLDPTFVLKLEQMQNDPDAYWNEVNKHLFWIGIQEYATIALDETVIYMIVEKLAEIAKTTIKNVGHGAPAGLSEYFIFKKEPAKFNWQRLVRKHIGTNPSENFKSTHRKESNRFPGGVGHMRAKNPKVLILMDTSGSVSQNEFREFFREIDTMAKRGFEIFIAEIDGNLERVYQYNRKNNKIEIQGRGGTNLRAACEYWNKHRKEFAAGILFTDGYDNVSDCAPVGHFMWVISSNGYQENVYPGGQTLFIPKSND